MSTKTLTFSIMDSPFEQARTTTAFRMIQEAIERGYNVNVFAYEGAVSLAFAHQKTPCQCGSWEKCGGRRSSLN